MALLWMDGFDHYGSSVSNMLNGAYAGAAGVVLTTSNVRTGTRCIRFGGGNNYGPRRVFGKDLSEVGIGYAFFIPNLPSDSDSLCLCQLRTNANAAINSIVVSSTGQLILKRGAMNFTGIVLTTTDPVVLPGSYQHFECRIKIHPTEGAVEVRLNGVTVLSIMDVNTGSSDAGQVHVGSPGLAVTGFPGMYMDDYYCWDTTGDLNNDFIGDKKVYTLFPDEDTATSDWVSSTGADPYSILANNPPNDGSEYLTAQLPGERTDVGMESVPDEVVSIAGIALVSRLWKNDAGNAKVVTRMVNPSAPSSDVVSDVHALSMQPTYYLDVYETDPMTDAPWTPAGVNEAQASIDRTE